MDAIPAIASRGEAITFMPERIIAAHRELRAADAAQFVGTHKGQYRQSGGVPGGVGSPVKPISARRGRMKLHEWLGIVCGCASPIEQAQASELESPSAEFQPQAVTQSGAAQEFNTATRPPAFRTLPASSCRMIHPRHGTVTVERGAKMEDDAQILFKLILSPSRGREPIEYRHRMFVLDVDDIHPGSSLGYGDIDMPVAMSGRGIGYAYHYMAALTAQEFAVDVPAVDTVVSQPMEKLCEGLGMTARIGGYGGRPNDVIAAAKKKVVEKGWSPEILSPQ